jgi:hypothetical protein
LDRFPEAFRRFEKDVYVRDLQSFQQLVSSFDSWAGYKWVGSSRQIEALKRAGEGLGFDTSLPFWVKKSDYWRFYRRGYGMRPSLVNEKQKTWRRETVTVEGKPQTRYRDLLTGRFIRKP